MKEKQKLATIIKTIRMRNKYTQDKMASILGVSKRQLVRIEKCEVNTSSALLIKLLETFEIPDLFYLLNERDEYTQRMFDVYELLKVPNPEVTIIHEKLDELYKIESLTGEEERNLDLISSFINYKETSDMNFIDFFMKEESSMFFMENIQLSNLYMLNLDIVKIKEYLEFIEKKKIDLTEYQLLKIYLNCLGLLLEKNDKDFIKIEELLDRIEKLIYSCTDYYYLLPVFFRHSAQYNYREGDIKLAKEQMKKASVLFEAFNMPTSCVKINQELDGLNE